MQCENLSKGGIFLLLVVLKLNSVYFRTGGLEPKTEAHFGLWGPRPRVVLDFHNYLSTFLFFFVFCFNRSTFLFKYKNYTWCPHQKKKSGSERAFSTITIVRTHASDRG